MLERLLCGNTYKIRYKLLQLRFNQDDRIEDAMSGVGGEIGKKEEPLSSVGEARKNMEEERDVKRQIVLEMNARKECLGA